MPSPVYPRDIPSPALKPTSPLGPADTRSLAIAAEILRERTMSMDPDESGPTKRVVLTAIFMTVVVAGLVLVFRNEVRAFLGLGI